MVAFPFVANAQLDVQKFAQHVDLQGAAVSVAIADMQTGEILQAENLHQRLCPASVWKLFTTTAAVKILGPDFRFRTVLAYDGKITGDTLNGNIYLIGGGDPALGSKYFEPKFEPLMLEWVNAIKKSGIKHINGKLVANSSHFTDDGIGRTWVWEDVGNYYGAGVSGLNIHDNTYFIDFNVPSQIGKPATVIGVHPSVPGLQIKSEVLSSSIQSDQAFIFGAPPSATRTVRGTLPAGREKFTIKGSLPNPPLFAVSQLQEHLNAAGIYAGGGITVEEITHREPATYTVLYENLSPPLSELVKHINVESDNLFAEALLRQMGAKNGEASAQKGLEAINEFYHPICNKTYPFFAYDGSGLSRFTAVSAAQIIALLNFCRSDMDLNKNILETLPAAGRDGTMKWFGRRTNLAGNLRAKSGSMEKVRAYAGYFKTFSGREVSFAVVVNNYDGSASEMRQHIENMLLSVYGAY